MPASCASCGKDEDHCRCNRYCALCGGDTNHTTRQHQAVVDEQEGDEP